jgi:hypothetical protein
MRIFIAFLFFLLPLFCISPSCLGHDIGVSQVTITENTNNRYQLIVEVSSAKSFLFSTPTIPQQCTFIGNPNGVVGAKNKVFDFKCENPLTVEDSIIFPWPRDGLMVNVFWADGSEVQQLIKSYAGNITLPLKEFKAGSGSVTMTAKRYTLLGIEHILDGVDHLLFVLGLLLLVEGKWRLIKTITAFTLAHSITLGLATFGLIDVPSKPVEAVIALSIVLLAVEIIRARKGSFGLSYRFPWIIAFAFGLIHGLGFAGALADIGVAQKEIPLALLFFNVGVEIGQLIFVTIILVLTQLFLLSKITIPKYAQFIPAYMIGITACYWLIDRMSAIVLPV